MKQKVAELPLARDIAKAFPAPPLVRDALHRALKNACRHDQREFVEAPPRKRRPRPSVLDAHFYDLAGILLPDPNGSLQNPQGKRLTLQGVSEALQKRIGLTLHPTTIGRYLHNHPTLKGLVK